MAEESDGVLEAGWPPHSVIVTVVVTAGAVTQIPEQSISKSQKTEGRRTCMTAVVATGDTGESDSESDELEAEHAEVEELITTEMKRCWLKV